MLDVLIVIAIIISLFRGYSIGFVRQFLSTIGFFGGLLLGAKIEKYTIIYGHTTNSKSIIGLITTLGTAFILVTIMEYFGIYIKNKLNKIKINQLDSGLGSIISLASLILGIWLIAALINSLRVPQIQPYINQSRIIKYLNNHLPPAPVILADLGKIIDPNGFPQVFINGEPVITNLSKLPNLSNFSAVINNDQNSVVKIIGQGCGGIVEGSGFIVAPNLIMTNAHVVAGITSPYITTLFGRNYDAHTILFDPNLDLAILKVNGLTGPVLTISSQNYPSNTQGIVMGYPGGGSFSVVPATIINQVEATGQNIYGTSSTTRSIYEINAQVIPGNSGGPLINSAGQVIGIVFAQSTSYNHVGYALTTQKPLAELTSAENNTKYVSTGNCAQ